MYLFLDTETTGYSPQDRIVAVCWSFYDSAGGELSTVHHIIRPDGFSIPKEAVNVHGITTEIARRRGIPLAEALVALYTDIAARKPSLYVGHNVSFDQPILLNEYLRIRHPENFSSLPTFCTMKGTTHICRIWRPGGGYKWPTLEELHRHLFGCAHDAAHDARGDVRACAKCFFELRRRGLVR